MNEELFYPSISPIFDVRSPSEFSQGHIPGALSLPLFSDEERALVGTLYKKEGKEAAVKEGLYLVGPKLHFFVLEAEKLAQSKKVYLYCSRGGMRSHSMSWLLTTAGFHCSLLVGGYKIYRKWVLQQFEKKYSLVILGGFTGSGKTALLQRLKEEKKLQVLNLEQIANHKGSSFGQLGQGKQPSSEHFENQLAHALSLCSSSAPIWVEDESRMIGSCRLPEDLSKQMDTAPFVWLDIPKEQRIAHLCTEYGQYEKEELISAIRRLTKRIGQEAARVAIEAVEHNDYKAAVSLLLEYYDKTYAYACQRKGRSKQTKENQDLLCHLL